ncbi:MAG: hypothetical protein AB9842_12385 [Bacteroidales bacterium]
MMTEENQEQEKQAFPPVRPVFLSIICIFTFLGSGFMAMSFFFAGTFHDLIIKITREPEFQLPGVEIFQNTPAWAFLAGSILYLTSLCGGIFIWNLKKIGFHIYTSSQIALLFLTSFYVYPGGLPSGDLLFTSTFILLYSMHLRIMR